VSQADTGGPRLAGDGGGPLVLGVCAGLARRLRVGVGWVRGAALVLLVATWVTALVYGVAALMLPGEGEEGLSWRLRWELRWRRLGDGVRGARRRLEAFVARWAADRVSASAERSLRALVGGSFLLAGVVLFAWSLPWIDSLDLLRALGLGLALLGVGILGERSP